MKDLIHELQEMQATYTVDKFISAGSYGAVCAGLDVSRQMPVAIKRVYSTVSDGRQVNILSEAFLAKRVLREVKLLCHFRHPNILGLRDVLHHRCDGLVGADWHESLIDDVSGVDVLGHFEERDTRLALPVHDGPHGRREAPVAGQ